MSATLRTKANAKMNALLVQKKALNVLFVTNHLNLVNVTNPVKSQSLAIIAIVMQSAITTASVKIALTRSLKHKQPLLMTIKRKHLVAHATMANVVAIAKIVH
jgi:hypothetical protein